MSKYCIEELSYLTENWVPTQYFDNEKDALEMFKVRKFVSEYSDELRKDIRLIDLETGNVHQKRSTRV